MQEILSLPDIEALARDSLTRAGVDHATAQAVAAETAAAEALGEPAFGMEALLRDLRLIRYGRIRPDARPVTEHPRPGVFHLDARHGFAAAALARALPELADCAKRLGRSMLRLDHASDPGAMICAVEALAQAGCVAIAFGPEGPGRIGHPELDRACALPHPPRAAAPPLLPCPRGLPGQPADGPLGDAVGHSAWLLVADPATADAAIFGTGPDPIAGSAVPAREISLTADLLAEIVAA